MPLPSGRFTGRHLLATAGFVVGTCLSQACFAQDVPEALIGSWHVRTIGPDAVDPGIDSWIEFEESGTVDGSGGCNSIFGPYSLDGGVFKIGPLAAGRKACPPNVLKQEQALLKAIPAVREFSLQEENQALLLRNGAGEDVMRLTTSK